MKVNNKDSIMISHLYDAHQFQESDLVKIVKNGGDFSMDVAIK